MKSYTPKVNVRVVGGEITYKITNSPKSRQYSSQASKHNYQQTSEDNNSSREPKPNRLETEVAGEIIVTSEEESHQANTETQGVKEHRYTFSRQKRRRAKRRKKEPLPPEVAKRRRQEYQRQYYLTHLDHAKEYQKQYNLEHKKKERVHEGNGKNEVECPREREKSVYNSFEFMHSMVGQTEKILDKIIHKKTRFTITFDRNGEEETDQMADEETVKGLHIVEVKELSR